MKVLFLGDFFYDDKIINQDIIKIGKYIEKNKFITVLNLEGPLNSGFKTSKKHSLYSDKSLLRVLKILNVKAVNLANNHIMDWGKESLDFTIKELKKNNIQCFGAGMNMEEALQPAVLNLNKNKVALYGFSWKMEESIIASKNKPGVASLNFKKMKTLFDNSDADYIIPVLHMGYEFEKLPQPSHLAQCRNILANKKIKLIIGHHPHVVQAFEKDKNIYYSLGNFYFGSQRSILSSLRNASEDVNEGLGVILDVTNWNITTINIIYENGQTVIKPHYKIKNLINIDKIKTVEYDEYFIKYNNTINKSYIYKNTFIFKKVLNKTHYLRRTIRKLYLRKIKWPIIEKAKKTISKIKRYYLYLLTVISPKLNTVILYRRRMGKSINLKKPLDFNEKIQWLKLYYYPNNQLIIDCSDKLKVREYVASKGCGHLLNEIITTYDNAKDINWFELPNKFVLKWNYGSGYNLICKDKNTLDFKASTRKMTKWGKEKFHLFASEMHYKTIKKKIICEKFLSEKNHDQINDYKIYCFNGTPYCVMFCAERNKSSTKYLFYDVDFNLLRINKQSMNLPSNYKVEKPKNLKKMFAYAKILAQGFPFVRVDFYNIDGKIIFGELTFTPSAGLDKGYTDEGLELLGDKIKLEKRKK